MIEHIYVLNLARAPDRKIHSINILKAQGLKEKIDFTILNGVDGGNISKEDASKLNETRKQLYKKNKVEYSALTRGQIGCVKSHMLAYEHMIQKKQEVCMIIEDDSSFLKPYSDIIQALERFPLGKNFDYILLHRKCPNLCLRARTWPFVKNWFDTPCIDHELGENSEYVKAGMSYGTNSQIVTLNGAKKLIDWCQNIYDPMDIQIHLMNSHTNIFDSEKHETLKIYSTTEPWMQPCGFSSLTQRIR
jgi:glycosyl transferase family 25